MGWIDQLTNQSVGLDTAPLIYFIEENPAYLSVLEPFFQAFDDGQFQIFTSSVTLLETLMFPLKHSRADLVTKYEQIILGSQNLAVVNVTPVIAKSAAQMRATYNIRTPDAIQIATAVSSGCTSFLTNDKQLRQIQELNILILDNLK